MKYLITVLLAFSMTSCMFGPKYFNHEYESVDIKTKATLHICADYEFKVGDNIPWGVNLDNVAIYSPMNSEQVATITKVVR